MSDARSAILQSIGSRRGLAKTIADYVLPEWTADPVAQFIAKAKASVAKVHEVADPQGAPALILSILAQSNAPRRLHVPACSPLLELPWQSAPGLEISSTPPTGEDSAIATADYGIAETGTLVFCSGARSASSWHFRPGREFALLRRAEILPRLEDVIRLVRARSMPATLNLVTGPSRTADIEQTIELGAHGPRELHILLAG
jgi:L-lactate dehydrogenase complex protein LldG